MQGAEIIRHNRVTDINQLENGEWEVVTEKGTVSCEHVVNAAGSFAGQVGEMVGLKVPMVDMVHQYLVTESIPEVSSLQKEIPVVRDPWSSCYYRQEQQGLVIGPYEMNAEAWDSTVSIGVLIMPYFLQTPRDSNHTLKKSRNGYLFLEMQESNEWLVDLSPTLRMETFCLVRLRD